MGWSHTRADHVGYFDDRVGPIEVVSLLNIQKPMPERTKALTEGDLEKLWRSNLKILMNSIEELQLGSLLAQMLEIGKELPGVTD